MLAGLDQGGSEADSPVTRHRLHQHSDPAAETPPHPPTPAAAVCPGYSGDSGVVTISTRA